LKYLYQECNWTKCVLNNKPSIRLIRNSQFVMMLCVFILM